MPVFVKRALLISCVILQFLLILPAAQRTAYAYVDPGSGLLAVQFLSSIIGGGIFFLRRRLKQIFFPSKCVEADVRNPGPRD